MRVRARVRGEVGVGVGERVRVEVGVGVVLQHCRRSRAWFLDLPVVGVALGMGRRALARPTPSQGASVPQGRINSRCSTGCIL